jgi:hypothetical protein
VAANLMPDYRDLFYGNRRMNRVQLDRVLGHLRHLARKVEAENPSASPKTLRQGLLHHLLQTHLPMSLRFALAREPRPEEFESWLGR